MKNKKLFWAFLASVAAAVCLLCACTQKPVYHIEAAEDMPRLLEIGDEVDFTQYFTVTDRNGNRIVVTEDMLDLSEADTSRAGFFTVWITVGDAKDSLTFYVEEGPAKPEPEPEPGPEPEPSPADILAEAVGAYADPSEWNFAVDFTDVLDGETYTEYYEYRGRNVMNSYTYEGVPYVDYLGYDEKANLYSYYYDNGDGTYEVYDEGTYEYEENYYNLYYVDLTVLGDYAFSFGNGRYVADDPSAAGNGVLGEYEGYTWVSFELYLADGKIAKIVAVMNDGDTQQFAFSKYGEIRFTLPEAGTPSPTPTPSPSDPTVMEKQTYNAATFDGENLQDKMLKTDEMIGLPSVGSYSALVVPVQFSGDAISESDLADLRIAFNGSSTQTGWESVNSYYRKASYGKLNLMFDIQPVYKAQHSASYYERYQKSYNENGETYTETGDSLILQEVLSYYESSLDLTKYDYNGDGALDAVYLIYSAPVDYTDADFYWAYVTWYYGEETYDGLYGYSYLFAGLQFMDESTQNDPGSGYGTIPGLKINAATYIHETGHLLGLDDYYDYEEEKGCGEGVGGADMMDYNVGDHDVYSKIMLGWLEPEIVNETKTVTIRSSQSVGDAILIPLDFDNSYFCEYLLIDLYAAQGLNELHASVDDTLLYGGAAYGVRIYHISSSADSPYADDYGSFTDYNNSTTDHALIKLVEADGETAFRSSGGLAASSDLWRTGGRLSEAFPSYARNDGKLLNFDIEIGAVSATSATVTVTFR